MFFGGRRYGNLTVQLPHVRSHEYFWDKVLTHLPLPAVTYARTTKVSIIPLSRVANCENKVDLTEWKLALML